MNDRIASIYILLSIKTRIETVVSVPRWHGKQGIYILLSIKTRIETAVRLQDNIYDREIYILLSIKTRIETLTMSYSVFVLFLFISYYPLKQGLKLAT